MKKAYLYIVSLISLVILVVAAIMLINMALKTWVFPKADQTYYYAPKLVCSELPANVDPATLSSRDPNCDDPDYEAKAEAREKESRSAQRQRDAAQAVAMIIVAAPVFYYHWKLARKEA